ncbi:MAG: hypothetical protein HAW67_01505 [Endozoicomonadaceae bacterium]|nr:hypothetical protein [Endozoicomonadaceae bacterium]
MNRMTFGEYKAQIDKWTQITTVKGLTLSNGKTIPFTFWKTFLGLKRRLHQDFYNGTKKNKTDSIPAYIVRAIHFINLLNDDEFYRQVKLALPEFEKDKLS